jgi:hypothetical protein
MQRVVRLTRKTALRLGSQTPRNTNLLKAQDKQQLLGARQSSPRRRYMARGVLVFNLMLIAGCDRRDGYYPTMLAAESDGAVRRGWIPPVVSSDATAIHLSYNLDTNETWLRYQLPPNQAKALVEELEPMSSPPLPRLPAGGLPWWPGELCANSAGNRDQWTTLQCRQAPRCGDSPGYFAINTANELPPIRWTV